MACITDREIELFSKWDLLVSSTIQVSVGDQIRVTGGFREGKNVFMNNEIAHER